MCVNHLQASPPLCSACEEPSTSSAAVLRLGRILMHVSLTILSSRFVHAEAIAPALPIINQSSSKCEYQSIILLRYCDVKTINSNDLLPMISCEEIIDNVIVVVIQIQTSLVGVGSGTISGPRRTGQRSQRPGRLCRGRGLFPALLVILMKLPLDISILSDMLFP